MNQLDQIKTIVEPILLENGLRLYSLNWTKFQHMKALEISVISDEGVLDIDHIAQISEPISEALDASELISFEYLLDIGSAGAERELALDELDGSLGKYVYVKFKNPIQGADGVYGDLIEVDQSSMTIEYRVKQAKKSIQLVKENVAKIRLAVKV